MSERFRIVCYKRLECKMAHPMTWAEALHERQCLQLSHPENFYVIEEVKK
jgi:hypothetical protein